MRHPLRPALAALLLPLCVTPAHAQHEPPPDALLTRIAIGSCARQDRPQPVWDTILAHDPDLFIFLGDNVYADIGGMRDLPGSERFDQAYGEMAEQPGYQRLIASTPLLATWDDHDYGLNDAGVEFPLKAEAQQAFLNFFNVPDESPRRDREGIYHSVTVGPEGRRVQVILLDTRTHRSPLSKVDRVYLPSSDRDQTILGDAQWRWFEARLREPADLRLVVSSIQVVSPEHRFEKWFNHPLEVRRLIETLTTTRAQRVIFLTGDRHSSEVSRFDDTPLGYPLYDFTASGLTETRGLGDDPNPLRVVGPIIEPSFGLLTIDWDAADPGVTMQVINVADEVKLEHAVTFQDIQRAGVDYTDEARRYIDLPEGYDPDGDERWPLILFLHGAGERGDNLEAVRVHGPPKLIDAGTDLPAIVVTPQCPAGQWWDVGDLLALLDHLEAEYRVDPSRVYVTGLSMGGYGSWALAAAAPKRFAAAMPICGGGDPDTADALVGVPVWAFHGDADRVVPAAQSRAMIDALRAAGADEDDARLTLYDGVGHDSWTRTYADEDILAWLFEQRREDSP